MEEVKMTKTDKGGQSLWLTTVTAESVKKS